MARIKKSSMNHEKCVEVSCSAKDYQEGKCIEGNDPWIHFSVNMGPASKVTLMSTIPPVL